MKNNKENTVKLYGSEIITNFHPENKLYISTNMWMVHPYIHSFIYTYIHTRVQEASTCKTLTQLQANYYKQFFFLQICSLVTLNILCVHVCVWACVCVCCYFFHDFYGFFSLLFKILNDKWLGYLSPSTKFPFLHYFYT